MFRQAYAKIKMFLGLGNKPPQEYEVMVSKEVADYMNSLPPEEQAKMLNVRGPDLGPDTTAMSIRAVTRDHPQLGKAGEGAHLGQMSFNPQAGEYNRSKPTGTDEEIAQLVGLVPKGPWNRQVPTQEGGYALPLHNSRWKPGMETKIPPNTQSITGQPQPIETTEELERFLEMKLTPQLAASDGELVKPVITMSPLLKDMLEIPCAPVMILENKDKEPEMLDPTDRRKLTYKWLEWCYIVHSLSLHQAWEIGAKSMIDNEFAHGTMRKNVEILPWDVMDPYTVKIKYHDPQDKNDPWFEKDEE